MRRLIFLAIFVFGPAFAASTGPLRLKGQVPRTFSLALTPELIAANLPLNTTQSNTRVATIDLRSNSLNGYRITISSANGGKLVHQSVTGSTLPYSLRYNSRVLNMSSARSLTFSARGLVRRSVPIQISYTGVPYDRLVQGDYSDTVTFTISSI